jgi:hypothetical protein
MNTDNMRTLTLGINAAKHYLPVVTQFVESAALVFGLKQEEYIRLSLATEEIFLYLSHFVCPGKSLEVQCFNGFYYARVHFLFSAPELNLSGLNIASTIAHDRESDLESMGLLIASRSVDYFNVTVEKNNRVCLTITKEKNYPAYEEKLTVPEPAEILSTGTPDDERLKVFALLTSQHYSLPYRPAFFAHPGKLVDMVHSGEYKAIVAQNPKKEIVGGLLLFYRSEKIVQFYGPYCFSKDQEKAIGEALFTACIGSIARTKALGLLSLWGLPEPLRNNFESLGTLCYHEEGKVPIREVSFYRLLHEDPGFEIWTDHNLTDYLRREYRRLALAREIRTVRDMGETRSGRSLFSAEVYREQATVTLRPVMAGDDYQDNLQRHIRFLRHDHFLNLYVELDLGIPWHARMMDVLLNNHFKPGIILPFAGKSDLLIFQYDDENKS